MFFVERITDKNKTMKKRAVIIVITCCIVLTAISFAVYKWQNKCIDGVCYAFDQSDWSARIVKCSAEDTLVIPMQVKYKFHTYTVTEIENAAFENNSKIAKIVLPRTIKKIGNSAFCNCRNLEVIVCYGIKTIGDYAFSGCENLVIIRNIEKVNKIGKYAFEGCVSLSSIKVSVGVINEGTFRGCSKLETVQVDCKNINAYAFENCTSLQKVEFKEKIDTIGVAAFKNCTNLSPITYDSNPLYISKEAFRHCNSFGRITLRRVCHIGDYAFADCENLKVVIIGDSTCKNRVVREDKKNYWRESYYIYGNSLDSIGSFVFENCNAMTDIHIKGRAPQRVSSIMHDEEKVKRITLHIEEDYADEFKNHPWNLFMEIIVNKKIIKNEKRHLYINWRGGKYYF